MLLSAALIVRDEAEQLGGCLASIKDLVDEIVVVDTGSVDGTREVAHRFGARLFEFPWNDDFAEARNRGLEFVRGEWVLYIDADERALPCDIAAVREQLADPSYAAHEVLLRPRPLHTPYWILRLFRSDSAIRFQGAIHENIWPAVQAFCGGKLRVGRSPLLLDHIGYEGDQVSKHRRNLPLLQKALRHDPTRIFSWCHLADIHAAFGEQDLAMNALEKALAMVRTRRKPAADDVLPYVRLIHNRLENGRDVADLLAEALDRFPANMQFIWLEGRAHMTAGRYELAIPLFLRLVNRHQDSAFDHASAYDARIFGVFAYDSLATCYFRLRRYEESRRYYQLAAEADPGNLEYRTKRQLCANLARAGQT